MTKHLLHGHIYKNEKEEKAQEKMVTGRGVGCGNNGYKQEIGYGRVKEAKAYKVLWSQERRRR